MDVAECSLCGQKIVCYPYETEWSHYQAPDHPVNWALVDQKGCMGLAVPAKEVRSKQ